MLGVPAEAIAALEAESRDDWFEVWPENWEALCAFLSVSTQWRVVPVMGGPTYWQGPDYAGVTAGLARAEIATTPAMWTDLQVIEAAARNALNGQVERG